MPLLEVDTNNRVILINAEGSRFYVVYDNVGNAHTFSDFGNLGNHGFHAVKRYGRYDTESPCEFLGGKGPCYNSNRTTGPMHDENEIFEMLEESANRVNKERANA